LREIFTEDKKKQFEKIPKKKKKKSNVSQKRALRTKKP